ncbi:MAG: phage tail protein [Planctomycetes bacterium]|nr:phage tail protein [Planctomycetota bacterium]
MNNRYSWLVKLVCGGLLAAILSVCYLGSWGSMAQARMMQREPLVGAIFQVEVEGRWGGRFNTCSGIGSNNETVENKMTDKTGQAIVAKVPGRLHLHDITLSRGLTGDMKLWAWRQEVVVGKVAGARQKCTITMMSPEGKPVAVWELANAWPIDLTIGTKGDTNMVTEEVTIAHEGVTRRQ